MNHAAFSTFDLTPYVRMAVVYWRRGLVTAGAVALLAVGYAAVRPNTWKADQALIVRSEATTRESTPGKFRQPDEMKTVQETTLEVIRSRGVLAAALADVGPPANHNGEAWPSEQDIVDLRDSIKLSPPKGAEFGKTEVFYLETRDSDRQRAIALNRAIVAQLQARSQDLRNAKAESMIAELEKTVHVAQADLAESTAKLTSTETAVGGDLAELKAMGEVNAGDSALRRTATEIRSELRDIATTINSNRELLSLLTEARTDAGRLVAMPNRLLDSQPALRRLKEGLVDAQLNTARLEGRMSAEHPLVVSAEQAEEQVGRQLHDELEIAIRGLDVELKLNQQREKLLSRQLAEVSSKLDALAGLRASYTNELAQANHRKTLLERAEQNLSEARAERASANASSLISAIDEPDAGVKPIGPSRAMIVLAGIVGGLLTGLGVVLLTVPVPNGEVRPRDEHESYDDFSATPELPVNKLLGKLLMGSKA
jgi:uncharacterized protein involved in exopolysaccharide biosynthesis